MPELPEVEVVRRGLADHVVGQTIARARIHGTRVARRHPPGPAHLQELVTGRRVVSVDRRGKYLWLVLADPEGADPDGQPPNAFALIVHLGMSGQLLVQPHGAAPIKHTHAVFELGPADAGELWFVDQRTFGALAVAELTGPVPGHPLGIPDSIGHIAPDPLEEAFDPEFTVARLKASSSGIKRLLLNQNVVSGIGNIYADEALWRARIHGERAASELTTPALRRLIAHAQDVMRDSLADGGTSFDSLYVDVTGQSGYFARSLDAYGRAGQPCRRCGTLMRREQFMNRSSTYCPRCQTRPRYAGRLAGRT